MRTAECQDGVSSPDGPEHARLFETRADYCLASSFDHTRANKQMLAAKLGIAHTLCISFEVICLGANLLGHLRIGGFDGPQRANHVFDFPAIQKALLVDLHPGFLLSFVIRVQLARDLPKMLAGVVEIDNLNGVGKMQGHKIPNPFGAVADHDLLECAAPAASPGFPIDSTTKLFRTLDGSGI